jgi:hypothetical protein
VYGGVKFSELSVDIGALRSRLLHPEVFATLRAFQEPVLELFFDCLFGLIYSCGPKLAPSSSYSSAGITGDQAGVITLICDGECVTTALLAAKGHSDLVAHSNPPIVCRQILSEYLLIKADMSSGIGSDLDELNRIHSKIIQDWIEEGFFADTVPETLADASSPDGETDPRKQ